MIDDKGCFIKEEKRKTSWVKLRGRGEIKQNMKKTCNKKLRFSVHSFEVGVAVPNK